MPSTSTALRAERDADADLARALRDEVRQHAVDPERAEDEPHRAEEAEQDGEQSRTRDRFADGVVERERGGEGLLRIDRAHRVLDALDHQLRIARCVRTTRFTFTRKI